jgi:diguanylate cyclase (GGDEF)-like protein
MPSSTLPAFDAAPDGVCASMQQAERLIRTGRISNGLALIQQCWAALEQEGAPALQADCQRILGLGFQYSGELRESLLACFRARELYERNGDNAGVARTLSVAAVSLGRIGDSAQALDLLQAAHRLAQTLHDPGTEFRIWINMSVVYETLADYPKAIATAETAIALGERTAADAQMKLHAQTKLCIYRVKHGLERKAAGAHDEARELLAPLVDAIAQHCQLCRDAGFDHMVTAMLSVAGSAQLALGAPELARSVLEEGLALAMTKGLGREQARFLLTLGEAEHAAGEATKAFDRLLAALKLAQQLGEPELIAQAYLQLSRTLETKGDHAGALAHFRRYHETHVGTLRQNAATRAQVLAIQLDNERARIDSEVLRLRATELENDKRSLMSQAEQLSRHANEDPLTGLGNRRYFSERLAQIRASSASASLNVVLAIADIDHFKHVNDRFSHAIGDQVLRQVGALFREHCRPQDAVARFGGEEFVLALVDTSTQNAQRIADRLRQRIAEHDWSTIQPGLSVTISIGLADCVAGGEAEHAFSRADMALYAAKNNGRNQIHVAQ